MSLWLCLAPAPPCEDRPDSPAALFTDESRDVADKGLAWLASRQQKDGSFGSGGHTGNIAVTSLAGIALLTAGHMPGQGPYGEVLDKAIEYVLANTNTSGFIESRQSTTHGPMYSHGFGCLFLAEAYGMTERPEIREKLKKAVLLIITSQNREGGWRYQPGSTDADLSVTVTQIMALRAARNAGIHVPKEVVDKCTAYVKRSQNADGGFMYMAHGGSSAPPRSAAGVVALQSAGIYEGKEIEKGLEYLLQNYLPLPSGRSTRRQSHYFYGHYYAVQAMWQAGGDYWDKWYPAIRDELLKTQSPQGYWEDSSVCAEYGTAMAVIVLQTPNTHLPIFQR
jgi:prenyltransferase beta subunit